MRTWSTQKIRTELDRTQRDKDRFIELGMTPSAERAERKLRQLSEELDKR